MSARPQLRRPACTRLVTYADLAEWTGVTLAEAERRYGSLGGPERLRIAGEDYFWEHQVLPLLDARRPR